MSRRPPDTGSDALAGEPPDEILPPLDGRPGPARILGATRRAAMVKAIVNAALADEGAPARPEGRSSRNWYRALAAAAAILFCLSAAVVPALIEHTRRTASSLAPAGPPPPSSVPSREVRPDPAPAAVAPPRASDPAPHPGREPIASVIVHHEEAVDVEKAPLEDLLKLANERRRARDWRAADELYRAVSRRFPRSDAAVVAGVASASLHLEQLGDAAGALRDYRYALASHPTGPLAEEARWGIAEAERALGDDAAEGAALRDFLHHHPGSALAPAARRRQAELAR